MYKNSSKSDWKEVKGGVPHGCVLTPLLFIIYTNDIDIGLQNKLLKFANGTKILVNGEQ